MASQLLQFCLMCRPWFLLIESKLPSINERIIWVLTPSSEDDMTCCKPFRTVQYASLHFLSDQNMIICNLIQFVYASSLLTIGLHLYILLRGIQDEVTSPYWTCCPMNASTNCIKFLHIDTEHDVEVLTHRSKKKLAFFTFHKDSIGLTN